MAKQRIIKRYVQCPDKGKRDPCILYQKRIRASCGTVNIEALP